MAFYMCISPFSSFSHVFFLDTYGKLALRTYSLVFVIICVPLRSKLPTLLTYGGLNRVALQIIEALLYGNFLNACVVWTDAKKSQKVLCSMIF